MRRRTRARDGGGARRRRGRAPDAPAGPGAWPGDLFRPGDLLRSRAPGKNAALSGLAAGLTLTFLSRWKASLEMSSDGSPPALRARRRTFSVDDLRKGVGQGARADASAPLLRRSVPGGSRHERVLLSFDDYRQLLFESGAVPAAARSFPSSDELVGRLRSEALREQRQRRRIDSEILARVRVSRQSVSAAEIRRAKRVLRLARSRGSAERVLIERFNVPVTPTVLSCLADGEWLNDEVINFYVNLLMERNKRHTGVGRESSPPGDARPPHHYVPRVFIWSTFFYARLVDEAGVYNYSGVARWSRRQQVDIFERDLVLVPVHVRKVHWALCALDLRNRCARYFDSMGGNGRQVCDALLRWLDDEHRDKRHAPLPDLDRWVMEDDPALVPQQENSSDCGVFVCQFCECIADGRPLDFAQNDIYLLRMKMIAQIADGVVE